MIPFRPWPQTLDLPLPPGVRAWMSARQGGHSRAPWDSLNLGDHVGDDPQAVQANRQTYAQALGVRPVFMQQVHGWRVLRLQADTPDGLQADACLSLEPGLACTVMVADCLPVLLWDAQGRWVAAAHAGWRGLAGQQGHGVLEALAQALRHLGMDLAWARAWLGPCIGPTVFEVGPEVRAAFVDGDPQAASAFTPGQADRWWADLPGLARRRLQALGIGPVLGHDGSLPWCTVSQPGVFFSHRRDARRWGSTGRMAVSIALGG